MSRGPGLPDGSVDLTDGVVSLRPWDASHAEFIARACVDPEIHRYNAVPAHFDVADASRAVADLAATWRSFGRTGDPSGAALGIFESGADRPVGQCGIDAWSETDVAQIGYWLDSDARGNGYATRAVVLLTRWLFGLGAARVFMTIVAGNEPSAAVARRAGFVHEGTMRSAGVLQDQRCDVMLFAALPIEWRPTPSVRT